MITYKALLKKILLALSCSIIVIAALNLQFFWQNLTYTFSKPKETRQVSASKILEKDFLIIESLGIKTPIVYAQERSEKVYQVALQRGVVHYLGSAKPGEYGNVYIFGHSSDLPWARGDYKTVFALLPRIHKGAEAIITDNSGNPFVYTVTDAFVASADATQHLDQQQYKKRLLTLQTSYPLGTALKRYIVIAEIKSPDSHDKTRRKQS